MFWVVFGCYDQDYGNRTAYFQDCYVLGSFMCIFWSEFFYPFGSSKFSCSFKYKCVFLCVPRLCKERSAALSAFPTFFFFFFNFASTLLSFIRQEVRFSSGPGSQGPGSQTLLVSRLAADFKGILIVERAWIRTCSVPDDRDVFCLFNKQMICDCLQWIHSRFMS